jgi:two-component system chemotaxis response regulator CheY
MARVLVVDDAKFIRHMLIRVLRELGHDVVGEAENGRDALVKYKALKPDLVTMDITMPEMDGLSALTAILTEDPDARVIMCSALNDKPHVFKALKLGAKDFLLKPFQQDRVVQAVDNALARR